MQSGATFDISLSQAQFELLRDIVAEHMMQRSIDIHGPRPGLRKMSAKDRDELKAVETLMIAMDCEL